MPRLVSLDYTIPLGQNISAEEARAFQNLKPHDSFTFYANNLDDNRLRSHLPKMICNYLQLSDEQWKLYSENKSADADRGERRELKKLTEMRTCRCRGFIPTWVAVGLRTRRQASRWWQFNQGVKKCGESVECWTGEIPR